MTLDIWDAVIEFVNPINNNEEKNMPATKRCEEQVKKITNKKQRKRETWCHTNALHAEPESLSERVANDFGTY